jgi:alanyl-tRNA synthetase
VKTDELRERFLRFFEARGHKRYPSDLLVPQNDPSLLFTGAGMNQFKDQFLGRGKIDHRRACSSQKCLRTGDIDAVGRTPAHHTFFEMLGNFSFGDYFKADAIAWAWEFMTAEMSFPPDRLSVSVYTDDDEAARLWSRFVPAQRIVRLGARDNFWPADAPTRGPNGPCGPCSEIYYDFGDLARCDHPGPHAIQNDACKRFVEIWNLVFTQFDRREDGSLPPLPQKNIDTGMGLERLAAAVQGVWTNFEIDSFVPIVARVTEALKVRAPDPAALARIRRIADHLRAVTFLVADGVPPGNEGRNYVVRRLLRKAVVDAAALVKPGPLVGQVIPVVVDVMGGVYPELRERRDAILATARAEEELFLNKLEEGLARLEEMVAGGGRALSGEDAFLLHGTYGFQIEITEGILSGRGIEVDRKRFEELMEEDRRRSQESGKFGDIFGGGPLALMKQKAEPTRFLGYDGTMEADVTVLAIGRGDGLVPEAGPGAELLVLCDRTPFYGEGGGQIGDAGMLSAPGLRAEIKDTQKPDGYYLHRAVVAEGTLRVGMTVRAAVDRPRRLAIMRNHTGTHMLQAALRRVLGPHCQQTGSVVEPDRLRFDFSHPKAMTAEEIRRVEDDVNAEIMRDTGVLKREMSLDEAKRTGAIMFFGDKYGDRVRVVSVGDYSTEVCGGTHLDHAGTIGCFKVVSESSIGSGRRRIEAVTGPRAVELMQQNHDLLARIGEALGAARGELLQKLERLIQSERELKRRGPAAAPAQKSADETFEIDGVRFSAAIYDHRSAAALRSELDALLKKGDVGGGLRAGLDGEAPVIIVAVSDALVQKGVRAGDLAKKIGAACGAGGGGKPTMAQAGASDPSKFPAAVAEFKRILTETLS